MTKQQEFLDFWHYLTHELAGEVEIPANVQAYIDALNNIKDVDKPAFTENGKMILQYMQTLDSGMYKAKDIAEGLGISSKAVSGAMRKLVTDGYIEKIGKDPVVYTITDNGKNVKFEGENE